MPLPAATEELRRLLKEGGSVFDLMGLGEPEEAGPLEVLRQDITKVEVEPTWTDRKVADKALKRALKLCFEALFPKATVWIDPVSAATSEAFLYVDGELVDGQDIAFSVDSFEDFLDELQEECVEHAEEWSKSFRPALSDAFRRLKKQL